MTGAVEKVAAAIDLEELRATAHRVAILHGIHGEHLAAIIDGMIRLNAGLVADLANANRRTETWRAMAERAHERAEAAEARNAAALAYCAYAEQCGTKAAATLGGLIREVLGGETATRDEGPAKGSESHADARTGVETDAETLKAQGRSQAVYVAMIADRHTEPEPEVFTTAQAAIDYARTQAHALCRHPDDFEEEDLDGWLYYARYSCEGDSVWIIAKTLDSEAGGDETGNDHA